MESTLSFQIVVARYNEDVKWLLPFKKITILYNKGTYDPLLQYFDTIKLPNVGRESHSYLYHIVTNYDQLADKTIFFQGKISDHKILSIDKYFGKDNFIGLLENLPIEKIKKKIDHYGKWKDRSMSLSKYTPYEWLIDIIGCKIDSSIDILQTVWGANFSVSKQMILSKPKKFYENMLRYVIFILLTTNKLS